MRRAILKTGIAVAAAASVATLAAPAAQASTVYEQYITTYWYGNTWDECNSRGTADEANAGAVYYECDEVDRVIHGGLPQQGYQLWEYFRIS